MKIQFVKDKLNSYDSIGKGYARSFGYLIGREEPHIAELRAFVGKLSEIETDLSSDELLTLANILLGKNTRNESASAKTFIDLAEAFGGFAVLDMLKDSNALTKENLVMLDKNSANAKELGPIIASLAEKIYSSDMVILFSSTANLSNPERFALFKFLDTTEEKNKLSFYIKLLQCLDQNKIKVDSFVDLLTKSKEIIFIHQIIEFLASTNLNLLTAENVTKTLKLQEPYYFMKVLKVLPAVQEQLAYLFEVEDSLSKCQYADEIISNFKSAGWALEPWLKRILSETEFSFELSNAIKMLRLYKTLNKFKMNSDLWPLILSFLFETPEKSSRFADAVVALSEIEVVENDLKILGGAKESSYFLAKAIVALKKEKIDKEDSINVLCAHPKHAVGLAAIYIFFDKLNSPNDGAREIILKQPKCAEITAIVLGYLQENGLHKDANILTICKAGISDYAFLSLLKNLKKTSLLDQHNFDIICSNMNFIKTLASAANCLENAGKLDQENFDALIVDPINSLYLAENLGGKVFPSSYISLKDRGAKNLVAIRQNARIFSQDKGLGFFSALMTEDQVRTFEKDTKKSFEQAKKETLLKIAEFCGDNDLEDETKHHIADTAYSTRPGL